MFVSLVLVTCIFLLVFLTILLMLISTSILNLNCPLRKKEWEHQRESNQDRDTNIVKHFLHTPQLAAILQRIRFIWQDESIQAEPILHFSARQIDIFQCFHHIILFLKTLRRFHSVSMCHSRLISLIQQHLMRVPMHPPAPCNTDPVPPSLAFARTCPLCLKRSLPLSILPNLSFTPPSGFIRNFI